MKTNNGGSENDICSAAGSAVEDLMCMYVNVSR